MQASAPSPEAAPESRHDDDYVDEYAFAEDNPSLDEEPPEPEEDTITVKPGERMPPDAGGLLRAYYAPGIGDVRVYARLDPDEMDIDPGQVLGPDDIELEPDAPDFDKKPKSPR